MKIVSTIHFKWEKLNSDTFRAAVIGGWIVNTENDLGSSSVFIPDPNHEWGIVPDQEC